MVFLLTYGGSGSKEILPPRIAHLIFYSALIDVLSNVLCMIGLYMIGSGLFQVSFYSCVHQLQHQSLQISRPCPNNESERQAIYSAVICFAAILSRLVLKHSLTWTQIFGISTIFAGLASASIDAVLLPEDSTDITAGSEELQILAGIGVTLLGCVGYAGSYVLNEYILLTAPMLPPKRLCALVGRWGCLLLAAYLAGHTLPNWKASVEEPMRARQADPGTIAGLYAGLTASSFLHNIAYFNLLRLTGAVSTGVLTALRTIGVFLASGWLFCDAAPVQCLTAQKLFAVLVICAGVVAYAAGSLPARPASGLPGDDVELKLGDGAGDDGGSDDEAVVAGMTALRDILRGVVGDPV